MLRMLILSAFLTLYGCAPPASAGYEECEKFGNGEIVVSKLTNLRGMVVSHYRADSKEFKAENCRYNVRFVTNTGWVYTLEKMRPYELGIPLKPQPTASSPELATPEPNTGVEELDFGR